MCLPQLFIIEFKYIYLHIDIVLQRRVCAHSGGVWGMCEGGGLYVCMVYMDDILVFSKNFDEDSITMVKVFS